VTAAVAVGRSVDCLLQPVHRQTALRQRKFQLKAIFLRNMSLVPRIRINALPQSLDVRPIYFI